ncbi:hypothetical protein G6O67_007017 [Ophiocordyceps sinensis]|uniref:HNH nuclease domain-containing protein n=1 Tax=Ophiocordyceps sinensis TaxID=72228 RepID=A0A8H4LTA9_9HYPO|nr:hypothetical protein G6O67_007017 [Ophiocordyceps sinensis]
MMGDDPKYKYPVHPSFDHWRFPHNDLPALWSELAIAPADATRPSKQRAAADSRDITCRISGYYDATEVAHLIPRSAGHWFESNDMKRYCRSHDSQEIDDEKNLLLLRRDLHYLFDQRRFTFAAKRPVSALAKEILIKFVKNYMTRPAIQAMIGEKAPGMT